VGKNGRDRSKPSSEAKKEQKLDPDRLSGEGLLMMGMVKTDRSARESGIVEQIAKRKIATRDSFPIIFVSRCEFGGAPH
jgi:hypothetical protein